RRWYRRRNVPHRLCNGDCIGSGHTLYESSSNRAACPRLPSHGTEMAVVSARVTSLEEVLADAPLPLEPGNGRPAVPPESQADQQLLAALLAVRRGNFDVRLPVGRGGVSGEIVAAFNDIAEANQRTVRELRRLQRAVGRAGRINERAEPGPLGGDWAAMVGAVNQLL